MNLVEAARAFWPRALLTICCSLAYHTPASAQPVQIPQGPAGKALLELLYNLNNAGPEPGQPLTTGLPTSIYSEQSEIPIKQAGTLELLTVDGIDEWSLQFELQYAESGQTVIGSLLADDAGELEIVDLRTPRVDRRYLGYGVEASVSDKLVSAFPEALARYTTPGRIPFITTAVQSGTTTDTLENIRYGITLAERLTEILQTISQDRQLQVFFSPQTGNPLERSIAARPPVPLLTNIEPNRLRYQCGFSAIGIMEGNVGYVRMHDFGLLQNCVGIIDEVAGELSSSTAIILDLMDAGFGVPTTATYLASHFFQDVTNFSDLNIAPSGRRIDLKSSRPEQGPLLAEQRLYVLVSGNTRQIGEALAHDLKRLGRALIVGEPTEGFSDLTVTVYLEERFGLRVPNATYTTPDGQSLSGQPLTPDVPVLASQAVSRAAAMARTVKVASNASAVNRRGDFDSSPSR